MASFYESRLVVELEKTQSMSGLSLAERNSWAFAVKLAPSRVTPAQRCVMIGGTKSGSVNFVLQISHH